MHRRCGGGAGARDGLALSRGSHLFLLPLAVDRVSERGVRVSAGPVGFMGGEIFECMLQRRRVGLQTPHPFDPGAPLKPLHFFGTMKHWVTKQESIEISDLERTIIDGLRQPEYCGGLTDIAKGLWMRRADMNVQKLLEYATRVNIGSVKRRLGYLLELFGLAPEQQLEVFRKSLTATYVPLDPLSSGRAARRQVAAAGQYLARGIASGPEYLIDSSKKHFTAFQPSRGWRPTHSGRRSRTRLLPGLVFVRPLSI